MNRHLGSVSLLVALGFGVTAGIVRRFDVAVVSGEDMQRAVELCRKRLEKTPVELEIRDGPSVNVVQEESWVDLRLRYLVHPRTGHRVRNDLYERILERMNDNPDRVGFPVSRNR